MEHVKELLSEYIDGALAEAERRQVDSHLFTCAECRLELDELKAVAKMVGGLRSKALPAGFMDRLQKRRDQEARGSIVPLWLLQATQTHWVRPASVVVCAMIVMVVAFDRMNRVFSPTARILSPAAAPASAPVQAQDELSSFRNQAMHQMKDSDARAFADAKTPAESHMAPLPPLEEQAKLRVKAGAPTAARGASADSLTSPPAAIRGLSAARPEAARQRLQGAKRGAEEPLPYDKGFSKNAFAPVSGAAGAGGAASLPAAPPAAGRRLDGFETERSTNEKKFNDDLSRLTVGELEAAKEESLKTLGKRDQPRKAAAKKVKAPVDGNAIRTSEDLRDAWDRLGGTGTPPVVDFNSEMLLAIRGPAEIVEVRTENARILVSYRTAARPADGSDSEAPSIAYRIVPASPLPVVFQKLP